MSVSIDYLRKHSIQVLPVKSFPEFPVPTSRSKMGSQSCLLVLVVLISCAITAAVAQTCSTGNPYDIGVNDINTLNNDLNSGNYDYADPFSVAPQGWVSFTLGTVMFCTQNLNTGAFDHAQVSLAVIADEAGDISSACCNGQLCQGGSILFDSYYGPQLNLVVANAAFNCGGF